MKRSVGLLAGLVLVASPVLMASTTTSAPPATAPAPTGPQGMMHGNVGQQGMGQGMHGEHHPEMRRAMRALENASEALQHAQNDYNGHRARAEELIRQAQQEVKEGLESVANQQQGNVGGNMPQGQGTATAPQGQNGSQPNQQGKHW